MSSLRKKTRVLTYVVVILFLLITGANIILTVILQQKIKELQKTIHRTSGVRLLVRTAFFNLFSGFSLKDISCSRGDEKFFTAKQIDFGLDVLSLTKGTLTIKKVDVFRPVLDLKDISQIVTLAQKAAFRPGASNPSFKVVHFFETLYFDVRQARVNSAVTLEANGYLSFIKGNMFISRGELVLDKILMPAVSGVDFFRGSSFYKPFDYIFEAENKDDDFIVTRLEVSNPVLKFTGSGRLENLNSKPAADFEINFFNVLLDDFPSINHKVIQSSGVVDSTLKINGPLENLNILCNSKITNANLTFFNSILFSHINGSAVLSSDHIVGQNFSLLCNEVPFSADFVFLNQVSPQLLLQLFSRKAGGAQTSNFVLRFTADWKNDEFLGNIRTSFQAATPDIVNSVDCHLKDFRLKYEDDLFINADGFTAAYAIKSFAEGGAFHSAMTIEHFFAVLRRQENGFVLDHLKGNCYKGALDGNVEFVPGGELMNAKGEAHLRGLDVSEFSKDVFPGQYLINGALDGDLRFDSQSEDTLKGQFFVTAGVIENNPILDAVGNFIDVAALKKVSFDELSIFFSGGRGEYSSQVKLTSPQVNGVLDGRISSYDNIDGYLTVSLGTKLLNESKTFKKILTYIRHEEPFVVFPFKISSYIRSPRILWLKNEFKDKLQNLLPERNKRYLQGQVNRVVEKVEIK